MWNTTQRDPLLAAQSVHGAMSQSWAHGTPDHEPPAQARPLLAPYRRHTVATGQG
jgi:hypothetical protein